MTRALQRGMTLIELMVSLVVGSFLLVAVFGLMAGFEGQRRTLSAASGLDQTGSVAMFKLDQWIRSAGTGAAEGMRETFEQLDELLVALEAGAGPS